MCEKFWREMGEKRPQSLLRRRSQKSLGKIEPGPKGLQQGSRNELRRVNHSLKEQIGESLGGRITSVYLTSEKAFSRKLNKSSKPDISRGS